ncbi:inactive ubiquitin carboxyl-terminal hydrolase MINDY-4B isoform X1 [Bradysia coprophila]|uniref:inactive ubiquitin carboxyl-terminal hydrolase MINDY-4B isoform X1 n=1 Tax=Bradysia coprophila TaxID=38358 RepID=UPI00187DA021|nr:inactive ubiquitin carboxyl-terminal hydrolase MINDY-4B isoform X1 [Bradysia coprophila]
MAVVRAKLTGGTPITSEIAVELRKVVFGSAAAPPRGEWTRTPIMFGSHREYSYYFKELPFGLRSPRNATRGMQSVLQAYIMKNIIFDLRPKDKKSVPIEFLLKPNESQQNEALIAAMSEILWNIGEKTQVTTVLPGENPHVVHSHSYFQDSVTEKLYLFQLTKLEDLQIFLKRHLHYYTDDGGAGTLLFLYAAVMTRTPTKILTDLDAPKGAHLMGPHEEGSLNIVTLMLTGRATPYLHNGVVYVGDEDHYALPQFGILARAPVGLLVLGSDAENAVMSSSRQPGSRLKTPALPIWVASCSGHFGVLFNSNRELLRNYHAEKRFELHYYTCAGCYLSMTIDNRTQENNDSMTSMNPGNSSNGNSGNTTRDDIVATPLERLIHTKWAEAKISLKGPPPASLSY